MNLHRLLRWHGRAAASCRLVQNVLRQLALYPLSKVSRFPPFRVSRVFLLPIYAGKMHYLPLHWLATDRPENTTPSHDL